MDRRQERISAAGSRRPAKYRAASLAAVALLSIGAAGKNEAADPGPDPTWQGGVRLVEAALPLDQVQASLDTLLPELLQMLAERRHG